MRAIAGAPMVVVVAGSAAAADDNDVLLACRAPSFADELDGLPMEAVGFAAIFGAMLAACAVAPPFDFDFAVFCAGFEVSPFCITSTGGSMFVSLLLPAEVSPLIAFPLSGLDWALARPAFRNWLGNAMQKATAHILHAIRNTTHPTRTPYKLHKTSRAV